MHWKEARCILNYVQGTREFGIHYSSSAQLYLISFTVSDWDGDNTDKKSTSEFMFMLGSGPICWSSKKQATLSLSLDEVVYRGDVNATIQ